MHDPKITIEGGTVTIENPQGNHWYYSPKDGRAMPSVTTITDLYPKGIGFRTFLGNAESFEAAEKIKTDAGERGTRVHNACEDVLRGDTISWEEYSLQNGVTLEKAINEWQMITSFGVWASEHKPTLLKNMIEVKVISEKHSYGGSFDFACMIGDELHVVDIKTSKKIYDSYWLQLNAYHEAVVEMGMFKMDNPRKLSILRLGSRHKCGYEFATNDPNDEDFISFLACKQLWHMDNPTIKGPRIIEMPSEVKMP